MEHKQEQINLDTMNSESMGILLSEQYKLLIQTQNNINFIEYTLKIRQENKKEQ